MLSLTASPTEVIAEIDQLHVQHQRRVLDRIVTRYNSVAGPDNKIDTTHVQDNIELFKPIVSTDMNFSLIE
jgi:hypothetical protein